MVDISIIILSYNTKDLLRRCIESIQKFQKKLTYEIIIVDNASSDESVEMIKKEFPHLILIVSSENLGFAKGVNLASQNAKGTHLLFLNSDAEFVDTSLGNMLTFLQHHESAGIVGGTLKNTDGSLQRSFGKFYDLPSALLMLAGGDTIEKLKAPSQIPVRVDWVSGGFMLIKKDVFDALQGFDEKFFMYMEDMELCYRAHKKGYDTYSFPQATVIHLSQGSSNRSFAIQHIYKGLLYFYKKHKNIVEYSILKTTLLIKAVVLIVIGIVTNNSYLKKTYTSAIQS